MELRKRLVIDVGHPAEVHHYKYLYQELRQKGWRCLFVARDKDVTLSLLRAYHLPYVSLARNRGGVLLKLIQLPIILWRFFIILKRFKPSMAVSAVSLHCSWLCFLLRIPHIAFIDTEYRPMIDFCALPFPDVKITPYSYYRQLGRNHFRYHGLHQTAYLFPLRFKPDDHVLEELGLQRNESYVIVRFVAWKAAHDAGQAHMNEHERLELIKEILKYKRIFIVSEIELSPDLHPYLFPLQPHRLHHALAFADAYIGEGTTMAAEAAVLGTPAVLLNPLRVGYCLEVEKFGLMFRFDGLTHSALAKIRSLLNHQEINKAFQEKHKAFLSGQIDVTALMAWCVELYPESRRLLEDNPSFVSRFNWGFLNSRGKLV